MSQLLSGGLLAATMLLGQTSETPKAAAPTTPRPILGVFNREDRPVLNRIQGWFKRDQPESQPTVKITPPRGATIRETEPPPLLKPTGPAQPNDFPRKLPNPSSQAPTKGASKAKEAATEPLELKLAIAQQATPAVKTPILAHLANKIGRDEKFEWITGQIEIENGNFVMYYATPETVDKYNGRIVLAPHQADLSIFRKGDLVSIRGQLVQRQATQGVVPIYRVSHATLIERK